MKCRECEDSGYQWESYDTCTKCQEGAKAQYTEDKERIKWLRHMVRVVNKRIKDYENGGGLMPYAYCRKCDYELPAPDTDTFTIREIVMYSFQKDEDDWARCPECGYRGNYYPNCFQEVLADLLEEALGDKIE